MQAFDFHRGRLPLLISIPHAGTHVPDAMQLDMTEAGCSLADTDWHVDKLYGFASEMGASSLKANHSRYVIDLNRPADGRALYPGADETGLVPLTTFDRHEIWNHDQTPDAGEIEARILAYWQPYHAALKNELERLVDEFGYALLWDAHSIQSRVPRFFEGTLTDLNLGTNKGLAARVALGEALLGVARSSEFSAVLNGRFSGGYITRHYGHPGRRVHAVQLEIAQCAYMDEDRPGEYDAVRAAGVAECVVRLLKEFLAWGKLSA